MNTIEILWTPLTRGWKKCNTDGVVVGSLMMAASGGIFRDENANHLLNFDAYIGPGSLVVADFTIVIIAIEKANQ